MRRASNDKSIIKDKNNNVVGISLGYDFVSEHENGIQTLSNILKIKPLKESDLSNYKNVFHEFITDDLKRFYKKHNMKDIISLLSFNKIPLINSKKYSGLIKLSQKVFPHYKKISKLILEDYKINETKEDHNIRTLSFNDKRIPISLFIVETNYFNLMETENEAFEYLKSMEKVEKVENLELVKSSIQKILKHVDPIMRINIENDKIVFDKSTKFSKHEEDNDIFSSWSERDLLVIGYNKTSEDVKDIIKNYKEGNLVLGTKEMRSKLDLDNRNIGGLTFYKYDKVNKPAIRDNILRENIKVIIGYYALHCSGIYKALEKSDKRFMALKPKFSMENGKPELIVWLNPYDQEDNEYGWYSLDELFDWADNKGPIIENSKNYKKYGSSSLSM